MPMLTFFPRDALPRNRGDHCPGRRSSAYAGRQPSSLKLEWYEDLLRDLKSRYPRFNLHAFSAPEIWNFHKINKLPLQEILSRLKMAGMGSLPGGGGEILVDRVRRAITINKCLTDEWLEVHRVWHELGGRSTSTMMFGHVETPAERIESLDRLRQLQDETGGFTAFICWTFQPGHTALENSRRRGLRVPACPGDCPALPRQHTEHSVVVGHARAQNWPARPLFGANDMGSLMIEENVVASAGTVHYLTLEQIKNAIREAGYIPRQRNVFYEYVDGDETAVCSPSSAG